MSKFCTIITIDFVPFAKTLHQSLVQFDQNLEFYVLIVNGLNCEENLNFVCLNLDDLSEKELVDQIQEKYKDNNNALRWSLKSILLIHLLQKFKHEQVFFLDPDICFFSDFKFLFQELGDSSILLSPHWKRSTPSNEDDSFVSLFTHGLYNAGFVGATNKGIDILKWWAEMCLYACEDNSGKGIFVDQKYLDLFPLLNSEVKVLTHKGCNVAVWNRHECRRSYSEDGSIIINDKYPVVFVHFTYLPYLIRFDPQLVKLLEEYDKRLIQNGLPHSIMFKANQFNKKQSLRALNVFQRGLRKVIGHNSYSKYFMS